MNYNTGKQKIHRHDPLANRIIDAHLHQWLNNGVAFAEATLSSEEEHKGVINLQSKLNEFWIHVTPAIIDELQRAGLLKTNEKDKNDV
jgi:hypothetical protein